MTVEDLLRDRGQLVKRGTLGEDGDLEFWEDGTVTPHEPVPRGAARSGVNSEETKAAEKSPGSSFESSRQKES